MPKLKAKKEGSNGKRPPLEIPLASVASPTGQSSDVQKILSIDYDSQTDTARENPENHLLPVKITPKNLTGWKPVLSKKVKAHRYVCVVSLANVRKGPNMKEPIVRRIARGTEVEVIGKKGDWMQLKSEDGQSAWIYSTLLRRQN